MGFTEMTLKRCHTCTIYFSSPEHTIHSIKEPLEEEGLFLREKDNALFVRWDDKGPELKVTYRAGTEVQTEAAAVGLATEFEERLHACPYAFDIQFEDLEAVLDEINTLIQVQGVLQSTSKGVAFNSWNSVLSDYE
jgi:hypothetical protein